MDNKNIFLPALNLEVKRNKNAIGQTYALFDLYMMETEELVEVYSDRERFEGVVSLVDKIKFQWDNEDPDLSQFKFFIEACNKQDAYATMIYIAHRLKEAGLCDCGEIYQGHVADLNDMGDSSIPNLVNLNQGMAGINEVDEDDKSLLPKWQEEEDFEAVFFLSEDSKAGFGNIQLPSTSQINLISNCLIFIVKIKPEKKKQNTPISSPFFNPNMNNPETTLLDYTLHGFKHIEVEPISNLAVILLFRQYLEARNYSLANNASFLLKCITKFRNSLAYPISELDIKSFGDAIIENHMLSRSNPTDRCIGESAFEFLTSIKTKTEEKAKVSPKNPWKEFDKIIGMEDIKSEIRMLVNRLKLEKKRKKMGLPSTGISMNAVFLGSPGTNKTSMARLLAKILAFEKLIPSENFKECGKEDIVGQFVGWTAVKVKELFQSLTLNGMSGGVLFIDEAYSITEDQTSFDKEAINTLVQCMENYRNQVMVIFGGYKQRMLEFMNKNEGLRSRISFVLEFQNYSSNDLLEITKYQAALSGFVLEDGCEENIIHYFDTLKQIRGENFGNGREARTLYEYASLELSARLSEKYGRLTKKDLTLITHYDVNNAIQKALQREKSITGDIVKKRVVGFYN